MNARLRAVLLAGLVATVQSRAHAESDAEPVPPSERGLAYLAFGGAPIPGNGALLIVNEGSSLHTMLVTTPAGELIEGSFELLPDARYGAFRPSAPLEPGTHLIESTLGPPQHRRDGALSETFEVVEPLELAPPELMPEHRFLTYSSAVGAAACCELWTDEGVRRGNCASSVAERSAQLELTLTSEAPVPALQQFLYSVAREGTLSTEYAPWGYEPRLDLGARTDAYCYVLKALSIVDASVHTYDAACVSVDGVGSLGLVPFGNPQDLFDRQGCTSPPPALRAGWCEHNQDCSEAPSDPSCVLFDHLCEGGPAVEPPAESMPAIDAATPDATLPPIDDMPLQDAASSALDAGREADATGRAARSSGCGCRALGAAPRRSTLALSCFALACVVLGLRGRRLSASALGPRQAVPRSR